MTRLQQFEQEVKEITKKAIRESMPEPKMLDVEICLDLPNAWNYSNWEKTVVASGLEKQFFAKRGLQVCKKAEAIGQALIGKKVTGCFVFKQYKMYWLKSL